MRVPSAFLTIATAAMLAGCGAGGAPSTSAPASPKPSQASAPPASAQPASAAAAASAKPVASAQGTSSAAAAGTKVRGAWVAIAATQSPLWAARDGGYFAKHGLAADNTLIRG